MNAFESARKKTEARLERMARQEATRLDVAVLEAPPPPPPVVVLKLKEKENHNLIVTVTVTAPNTDYTFTLTKKNIYSHVAPHRIKSDEIKKIIKDGLQKLVGAVD